jgi:hypothetical protein
MLLSFDPVCEDLKVLLLATGEHYYGLWKKSAYLALVSQDLLMISEVCS